MAKYTRASVTAKRGVNHVRAAVEHSGSLFIKIDHENDLGVDAYVELIQEGKPLHKQVALQIKSGQSYFDASKLECVFPIGSHRDCWLQHPLPVYGVVYVPSLKNAYWVDLKHYLQCLPSATVVRFPIIAANKFDEDCFARIFAPGVASMVPSLSLDEALSLAHSQSQGDVQLGIMVLFRRFPNEVSTWNMLVEIVKTRPLEFIPETLPYYLAHIPWHPDIFAFGEIPNQDTRAYARSRFSEFGFSEVIKLLLLIDPEESISRGSVGQSVEAVISSLENGTSLMEEVSRDKSLPMTVRESAAIIYSMHLPEQAPALLVSLAECGSWYANMLLAHLRDVGRIDPYA